MKHNSDLQTPPGEEGLADILDGLYSYGTQSLDRMAFQKALDNIAANESAGYQFSLSVLKENFSRGVQLLAENELRPALPAQAFVSTSSSRLRSLSPAICRVPAIAPRARSLPLCFRRAIRCCARRRLPPSPT